MLLEKQAHLRNCGLNFTRFRTAPNVKPIDETPARCV